MKLFGAAMLAAVMTTAAAHGFTVDADLPAGNIVVDGIDGDTVKVRQDLRWLARVLSNLILIDYPTVHRA